MNRADWNQKETFTFDDLMQIVSLLRAPDGCPWDREQTHTSLRNNLVEEAYEVCEGIDQKNSPLLCEELGDVLLQVVFHSLIAEEEKTFTTEDVISGVCKKMIRRHPHVFGGERADIKNLQDNWDAIKRKEKGEESLFDTLSRIAVSLPALKRAEKFAEKQAPLLKPEEIDSPLLQLGEKLYLLCREATAEELDPEQALNEYLKKSRNNAQNMNK